ncbi:MAG TPA: hypothetical protein VE783_02515, partial [Candidatus Limnocylindrales bacterium]|nr:hypothetical protein [Candidatus Limnocylindrales bacterium]
MAVQLGFLVLRVQKGFPDVEALRQVSKDHSELQKIEVEFLSRNFLDHGHDPKKCDLIVCWINNWPDCPVEVMELSKMVEMGGIG